jgi:hypothetical protein
LKRLGTSSFKALATEIAFASVPKLLFLLTLYYFFSKVMFKHLLHSYSETVRKKERTILINKPVFRNTLVPYTTSCKKFTIINEIEPLIEK